ncbi:MAG TPA: TonB-dependent receptor [Candidatus Saccharimonadia bacterium]|nr:TonB-dependent receptor [Candidatus Saccharimonadia bacterium]
MTRAALLAALLAACVPSHVPAREQTGTLEEIHGFAVARGSLLDALAAIGETAGVRIVFPPATRELERRTLDAPIEGRLSVAAALDRALGDSGYAWRVDPYGTVVVEPARAPPRVELDTLTIEDTPLDASGRARADVPRYGIDEHAPSHTTLEGPMLDAQVIMRFDSLLRRAPNVSGRGSTFSVRGIERGDDDATTASVFYDGIPLGGRVLDLGVIGLGPLSRVEYQRGPRSLWEGVGALAGTISLESPDPSPTLRAVGALELDDHGARRGRAEIDGPMGPDGLSARVALESRAEPGFIRNLIRDEDLIDRAYERAANAKLIYEPDAIEPLTLKLTAMHARADPGQPRLRVPGGSRPFDPFARETFDPNEFDAEVSLDGARLDGSWRFGPRARLDLAATSADSGERTRSGLDLSSDDFLLRDDSEQRRELELRYTHAFDGGWTLLAGAARARRTVALDVSAFSDIAASFPVPVVVAPDSQRVLTSLVDTRVDTDSVLLELERRGEHWDFALGARRLDETRGKRRRSTTRLTHPECTITIGDNVIACRDEFPESEQTSVSPATDAVTVPRALVRFRPNTAHAVTLTYREGYLGGGARLNVLTGDLVGFQAERSESLDLSWDGSWRRGTLESRATLFANRWRDRQVPFDQPQEAGTIVFNAASARATGGELELRGRPSAPWLWWLGVGVLRTEYLRFPFTTPGGPLELAGNSFAGAPRRTASAGLAWEGPRGWHASINAWHSAETFSDARNSPSGLRDAYEVVDAKLGRRFGRWHVYGYITNAFDEQYVEDIRVGGLVPTAREFVLGPPRQVGLGVEATW